MFMCGIICMYQQLVKIITNLKASKEEYMGGFEERKGQEKNDVFILL